MVKNFDTPSLFCSEVGGFLLGAAVVNQVACREQNDQYYAHHNHGNGIPMCLYI
jgi:hypothetical protein